MKEDKILNHDPLTEAEAILSEDFYGRVSRADETPQAPRRRKRTAKDKPTHYKVICISMYTKDIENLEDKVTELKRRGYTKANRSQLIRFALSQVDIDKLPPPQP